MIYMKRFILWILRICGLVLIGLSIYTLAISLRHVNDDHSFEAVMGRSANTVESTETEEDSATETVASNAISATEADLESSSDEDPIVAIAADGSATTNRKTVTIMASFSNIETSIQGNLYWYLDGELVEEEENRLLVEGSMVTCTVTVDVENAQSEEIPIELILEFSEKTVTASGTIFVELPGAEGSITIRTEEITVTCVEECVVYADEDFAQETGNTMAEGDTALLLGYKNLADTVALQLQFSNGSTGWVDIACAEITEEDCTTDEDYTDEQKEYFVNSMQYDSTTDYLIWVSLYTQKVNIFAGYQGNWELLLSFDCATGVNATPTSTGLYTITSITERWNLTNAYVSPVIIFNGGEAFTSQPHDPDTDEVINDTIGEPASGGSVWLLEEDIQWMADYVDIGTLVVVY